MKHLSLPRTLALGTLAVLGATFFGVGAQPAQADSKTWKKAAIGAGAVAVYGLIKGDSKLATIGGVAAAGAYAKYQSEKKDERYDWRDDRYSNRDRYPNDYYSSNYGNYGNYGGYDSGYDYGNYDYKNRNDSKYNDYYDGKYDNYKNGGGRDWDSYSKHGSKHNRY